MSHFVPALSSFERKVFSQFGEDGVLEAIFAALGIETGTFLEIGIGPPWGKDLSAGLEGNCLCLRQKGWSGTWIDGNSYPPEFDCHQEFVTALNIHDLCMKYDISENLDCMSLDTDGQEYWIWEALQISPKVMVIEYNGGLEMHQSITMVFDPCHVWDGTRYHGASLLALDKLARRRGYVLVWCNGVNGIFIRKDLIANPQNFTLGEIFRGYPSHRADPLNRQWVAI